jgi:hypothetical protein
MGRGCDAWGTPYFSTYIINEDQDHVERRRRERRRRGKRPSVFCLLFGPFARF